MLKKSELKYTKTRYTDITPYFVLIGSLFPGEIGFYIHIKKPFDKRLHMVYNQPCDGVRRK